MASLLSGLTSGGGSNNTSSNSTSHINKDTKTIYDDVSANPLVHTLLDNANYGFNDKDSRFKYYDVDKRYAPANGMQRGAWEGVQGLNGPTGNLAKDYTAGRNALSGGLAAANGYFATAGAGPTATGAAKPWMDMAGKSWTDPDTQRGYLNPYIKNTVDAANKVGSDYFLHNTLPGINNSFIAGGGGFGSNYGKTADWALTNFGNAQTDASQKAYANAFDRSHDEFIADQNRYGSLATTAGNQATNDSSSFRNLGTASYGAGDSAARTYGGLSDPTLRGLNAQSMAGTQAQGIDQKPLDFGYQQFVDADNRNRRLLTEGADFAARLGLGVPKTIHEEGTTNTSGSTTGGSSSNSSPLGTLGGVASLAGSLWGANGLFAGAGGATGAGSGTIMKRGGHFTPHNFAHGGHLSIDDASTPSWYEAETPPSHGYWSDLEPQHYEGGGKVEHSNSWIGDILGVVGGIVGGMYGGPPGAMAGSKLGTTGGRMLGDIGNNDAENENMSSGLQSLFQMPGLGSMKGMFGGGAGGGASAGAGSGMDLLNSGAADEGLGSMFGMFLNRGGSTSPRRGHFAAGGHAPVVRAYRDNVRRDIDASEVAQSRAAPGARRPLQFKSGGHFATIKAPSRVPSALMVPSSKPGFFTGASHV